MYVLILLMCFGGRCNEVVIPYIYEFKEDCEKAAAKAPESSETIYQNTYWCIQIKEK